MWWAVALFFAAHVGLFGRNHIKSDNHFVVRDTFWDWVIEKKTLKRKRYFRRVLLVD